MMAQRSIPLYIVLSIVTCGIFAIYWYYCIASDVYRLNNNLPTTPGLTLVVNLITCGIYGIYAYYKWGQAMQQVAYSKGLPNEDRAILYVILAIFGLGIVNLALIQSDLNQFA